jgi:DNA-binding NarL/FixJ family response regulator
MCSEGLVAHETTVLVAVSSPRVREALVAVIGAMEGFRVVGEATTAERALQLARGTPDAGAGRRRPGGL